MAHSHPDSDPLITPTHQCEVLGQMLIRAQDDDMQTLQLVLERLKTTLTPLGFDVPHHNGARDPDEALRVRLNGLREMLNNLNENNPSGFESPWNMCCEALELVREFLYQQERGLSAGQVVRGYDFGC